MKKKQAQQEIVGFMIIILMVIIVGVIFLGIFLKPRPEVATLDAEISNFLISSGKYTSDCYRNEETKFETINDLVADCYYQKKCSDGLSSCAVLNKTYSDMLDKLWHVDSAGTISYYGMAFNYADSANETGSRTAIRGINPIIKGQKSKCYNKRAGSNTISLANEGNLIVELEICKVS